VGVPGTQGVVIGIAVTYTVVTDIVVTGMMVTGTVVTGTVVIGTIHKYGSNGEACKKKRNIYIYPCYY
jgi:hypothetical protein